MHLNRFAAGPGAFLALLVLGSCQAPAPAAPATLVPAQSRQALRGGADDSLYNFETGPQGWGFSAQGCPSCSALWVGEYGGQAEVGPTFMGDGSFKFHLENTGGQGYNQIQVAYPPGISAGDTLTFALWMPAQARTSIIGVNPYVKDTSNNLSGTYMSEFFVPQDGWMEFSIVNPYDTVTEMGVLFTLRGSYSGNVYLDSVAVTH